SGISTRTAATPPSSARATAMKGMPRGSPSPYPSPRRGRGDGRARGAQAASRRAVRDQHIHAAGAGLFLLGTDHEPRGQAPIPGGLRAEELPRRLVRLELLLMRGAQPGVVPLVRVDPGPFRVGPRERRQARGRHASELLQRGHALHVDVAPDALRRAWREADPVARLVDAVAHAVDPAE